jgi:LysM repeat protein
MEIKNFINLYIVQKNDTIASICDKFNITQSLFYQYNKILKYTPLVVGQPLHIISKQEIIQERENDELIDIFISLPYLIKEGIISSLYCEEYSLINEKTMIDQLNIIINEDAKIIKKKKEEIKVILEEIIHYNFKLIFSLKEKNKEEVQRLEELITSSINKLQILFQEQNLSNQIIELINHSNLIIHNIILKFILKKYGEVNPLFEELIKKINDIYRQLKRT